MKKTKPQTHTRNRPRVIMTLAPETLAALEYLSQDSGWSRSAVVDDAVALLYTKVWRKNNPKSP